VAGTPGTFMATAGASPVWKLLGKKPLSNKKLGLSFDNVHDPIALKANMPPPLTPLIERRRRLPSARPGTHRCAELVNVPRVLRSLFLVSRLQEGLSATDTRSDPRARPPGAPVGFLLLCL
jgi:hypothetical protein